jgi:hypothetical protein
MVPDCVEDHVYVSIETVSLRVGLTLTVTLALLEIEEFDLRLTTSSKTNDVSELTLGALTVAVAEVASMMLTVGEAGDVLLHLKFKSLADT